MGRVTRAGLYAVEGIDGTGKTTAVATAARFLGELGHDVLVVREPGGTEVGQRIRSILLESARDAAGPADDETRVLLFEASRSELLARVVEPALARGRLVLMDRYVASTRVYQAAALGSERLARLHDLLERPEPAITFYLEAPVEVCAARAAGRGEVVDEATLARLSRLRAGYMRDRLANRNGVRLDATRPPADVAAALAAAVDREVGRAGLGAVSG